MTIEHVRVGEVLALRRSEVSIEPTRHYTLIGVYSFGKGIFHREPKLGVELGDYRYFSVEPGDLVVSNIQAWEGALGFATANDAGTIGTHRFLSYVPRDGRIDTNWAHWFFLSEPGMALIRQAAPGSTIRNRTLAIDRFEALKIPLPPIDEQHRAAGRLDSIARATERIAERSAHGAALRSAFEVSSAACPDLTNAAKTRHGWHRRALRDVASLSNKEVDVNATMTYEVAGVYSFGRGVFSRGPMDGASTSYRTLRQLCTDQLVMSRLKAWEGALAVVPEHLIGHYVSPEFPTFELDKTLVEPQFIHVIITSERFWSRLRPKGVGARRERVTAQRLLEQEIDLPSLDVQHHLSRQIFSVRMTRELHESASPRCAALVTAALNDAFAGLT